MLRLARLRLRRLGWSRVATAWAIYGAVAYAVVAILLRDAPDLHPRQILARGISVLTWTAAAVGAFAVARSFQGVDERDGWTELLQERGLGNKALERAYAWAACRRVSLLVGAPSLALWAVLGFAAETLPEVLQWLRLLPGLLLYAGLVGLALASLARYCASQFQRSRTAWLALVLVPEIVHRLSPDVPSLPSATGLLLRWLLGAGA